MAIDSLKPLVWLDGVVALLLSPRLHILIQCSLYKGFLPLNTLLLGFLLPSVSLLLPSIVLLNTAVLSLTIFFWVSVFDSHNHRQTLPSWRFQYSCCFSILSFCSRLTVSSWLSWSYSSTHIRGHTLDLLISRGLKLVNVSVKDITISDHFLISADINLCTSSPVPVSAISYHSKSHLTPSTLSPFLSSSPLNSTVPFAVEEAVLLYNSSLMDIIDSVAPVKTRGLQNNCNCPWYTPELRQLGIDLSGSGGPLVLLFIKRSWPITSKTID